jgi:hypothetical protein
MEDVRRKLLGELEPEATRGTPAESASNEEADSASDDEEENNAYYRTPAYHPNAEAPLEFIKHLRPVGLSTELQGKMIDAQQSDRFCARLRQQLGELTEMEQRVHVRTELEVRKGRRVAFRCGVYMSYKDKERLAVLRRKTASFNLIEGVLYHRGTDRIGRHRWEYVVPESVAMPLVAAAHDSMLHLGRKRTLDALRASRLWWDTMKTDVHRYVQQCQTCAFNKVGKHHGAMQVPDNGSRPWENTCVDVVHLEKTESGMSKAVVFSDRFGRGVRAFPCTAELDSEEFLNIVSFGLIPDVGMPRVMVSDRGSNLISKLCMAYYEAFGITPRPTDAHMHTGVALTERFNATLREMARAAYFDSKRQWDLYLPYIVMFYNATVQESTGFSPYFIEHGREPSLPWQPAIEGASPPESLPEYVRKHILALHLAWDVCARNLEAVERQRKAVHDAKYQTNVRFAAGDRVLLLQPGRQDKMAMPFIGPYRVVTGPDERDRYQLRDLEGRRFNHFHVSKLKLWPDTDNLDDDYYVIERIVDSRVRTDGQRQYRIRWRGWSKRYDTWETLDNLNEAAAAEARLFDQRQAVAETADDEAARATVARPRPLRMEMTEQSQRGPTGPSRTNEATSRATRAPARAARSTQAADAMVGSKATMAKARADEQRAARNQRVAARGHRFD